ncbi:DNA polymerase III subunit alpha [Piscibacillus halophilus]|uniref:DNA polymerase III subunit alpha n=1 Tax=Piscibacillus halophilus TaxID=571933 RepID=A0A1H9IDY3_9BACI|nr:DNA polymerase III subunit alpha [Piscibacillus halophilus]SEQ72800.1 DNA polymerase-3 subunit alpha [Piscibacillus halophilus]
MAFVHLQVKSSYSFLQSTVKIQEYVQLIKSMGMNTCVITDHQVLHGAYEFYQACRQAGVKPVIGMSLDVYLNDDQRPITCFLYAKDFKGYQSLVHLSNLKQLHKERMTLQHIKESEQIIPIISFYDTYLEEVIYLNDQPKLKEILEEIDQLENYYVKVDPISATRSLVTDWLSNQLSLQDRLVLMTDVRYLKEKDRIGFESLYAIHQSTTISNIRQESNIGTHLLSEEEINDHLGQEWIHAKERTSKVVNSCHIQMPNQWFGLPKFTDTDGKSSDQYLENLCKKQLTRLYPEHLQEQALKRLNHELNVIKSMSFSDYFLIVKDMVDYAKREHIFVGPGRGSAAGSLVAYLLGIIEVDPLKYGLLFERFLNPERKNMPDIDIDFSDYRRDEVIRYVSKKYGQDRVAQIMTFGTFQARSTIRELSKVFDVEKDQLTFLLKQLPNQGSSLKDVVKSNESLKEAIKSSSILRQMFQAAVLIEGLPRHYSTHAAGIVISDQPLTKYVPVVEGQDLVMLTQYPMQQLEAVGLLKMDLLGLRNLTLLERMVKQVQEIEGKTINLKHLPLNNERTYNLLKKGMTTGVFQLESNGMKQALRAIKPNQLEDIVAVNALFRPGPMQFIETFAKRKHRQEQVSYIHASLKPILEETYGVLVYQEQIMQAVNRFAGFSYGQADLLRRAISKKNRQAIHEMKQKFLEGSKQNGYDESTARELFDWIERFADYGFNKSHAVAYSMISYQTAYFKANYPAYFYSELISSVMHDDDKVEKYIKEARVQGIKVLPPSINNSFGKFTVTSSQEIRFGLLAIKNVGKQAYDEIVNARKKGRFKDIFDFCKKVNLKVVNQTIIETLIMAGAFDETKHHRAQLLSAVMPAMEQGELFSDMDEQLNWSDELFDMDVEYPNVQPFPIIEQLKMEKESLGFVISPHPLSYIRRGLKRQGFQSIREILSVQKSYTSNLVVHIERIKQVRTKRGEQMAFLTLQDETTEIDAVMFPKLHREVHRNIEEGQFVRIKGRKDQRNGENQLILDEIEPFDINQVPKTNQARIYIKFDRTNEEAQLEQIKKISQQYLGNTPVVIYSPLRKKTYQLSEAYDLPESQEVIHKLEEIFTPDNVKVKKA